MVSAAADRPDPQEAKSRSRAEDQQAAAFRAELKQKAPLGEGELTALRVGLPGAGRDLKSRDLSCTLIMAKSTFSSQSWRFTRVDL